MNAITRHVSVKKPNVPKPSSPLWLRIYGKHLNKVFSFLLLITVACALAFVPLIIPMYLLIAIASIPVHVVHNGWWFLLADLLLSIFWYTGAYAIWQAYENRNRRKRY